MILSDRFCNSWECWMLMHLRTMSSLGSEKNGRNSYWNRLGGIRLTIDSDWLEDYVVYGWIVPSNSIILICKYDAISSENLVLCSFYKNIYLF